MPTKQDYQAKMESKKQARADAGIVSERFPTVDGIVISMIYYHNAENPILMERTVNEFPSSQADFMMECMVKTCEGGGFDLTPIIKKQIKQRKKTVKGSMACKNKSRSLPDHASIDYEITAKFKRRSK